MAAQKQISTSNPYVGEVLARHFGSDAMVYCSVEEVEPRGSLETEESREAEAAGLVVLGSLTVNAFSCNRARFLVIEKARCPVSEDECAMATRCRRRGTHCILKG